MATATSGAPSVVIEQPHLQPPRISLLTVADVVDARLRTEGGGSAIRGVEFAPEGCGIADVGLICPTDPYAKDGSDNNPNVLAEPFVVWAADKCSVFGFRGRDFYGRARRQLLAAESFYVEREFMSSELGINRHVIDDENTEVTTITDGALDPVTGLAQIEDEIGNCSRGNRMMIHMRPGIVTLLAAAGAIRREGNVWLTPTDNLVVPGRGYSGASPAGVAATASSEWIYATSMVTVYRDEVVMTPPQAPITPENPMGIPAAAVERRVNDLAVFAERLFVISWDPSCCVLAAEVTRTA